MAQAVTGRARRKRRIRKKIEGTTERPRLTVFRSTKHIYGQVIDDSQAKTLAAFSSASKDAAAEGDKKSRAKSVGEGLAKLCKDKGIEQVVFDRNGYLYHGRVKAFAEGAREGGLNF